MPIRTIMINAYCDFSILRTQAHKMLPLFTPVHQNLVSLEQKHQMAVSYQTIALKKFPIHVWNTYLIWKYIRALFGVCLGL